MSDKSLTELIVKLQEDKDNIRIALASGGIPVLPEDKYEQYPARIYQGFQELLNPVPEMQVIEGPEGFTIGGISYYLHPINNNNGDLLLSVGLTNQKLYKFTRASKTIELVDDTVGSGDSIISSQTTPTGGTLFSHGSAGSRLGLFLYQNNQLTTLLETGRNYLYTVLPDNSIIISCNSFDNQGVWVYKEEVLTQLFTTGARYIQVHQVTNNIFFIISASGYAISFNTQTQTATSFNASLFNQFTPATSVAENGILYINFFNDFYVFNSTNSTLTTLLTVSFYDSSAFNTNNYVKKSNFIISVSSNPNALGAVEINTTNITATRIYTTTNNMKIVNYKSNEVILQGSTSGLSNLFKYDLVTKTSTDLEIRTSNPTEARIYYRINETFSYLISRQSVGIYLLNETNDTLSLIVTSTSTGIINLSYNNLENNMLLMYGLSSTSNSTGYILFDKSSFVVNTFFTGSDSFTSENTGLVKRGNFYFFKGRSDTRLYFYDYVNKNLTRTNVVTNLNLITQINQIIFLDNNNELLINGGVNVFSVDENNNVNIIQNTQGNTAYIFRFKPNLLVFSSLNAGFLSDGTFVYNETTKTATKIANDGGYIGFYNNNVGASFAYQDLNLGRIRDLSNGVPSLAFSTNEIRRKGDFLLGIEGSGSQISPRFVTNLDTLKTQFLFEWAMINWATFDQFQYSLALHPKVNKITFLDWS